MVADSMTVLAGLPPAWQTALAHRFEFCCYLRSAFDEPIGDGLRAIDLTTDEAGDDKLPVAGVTTAIVGALAAPRTESLKTALLALEIAVTQNDFHPIRQLTAVTREMLAHQAGKIVVVTYDPRALTAPEDAPARGSARGILAYCESLRPALKQRGIQLGLLLLSPRRPSPWDLTASTDSVVAAITGCLQTATLQRQLAIT